MESLKLIDPKIHLEEEYKKMLNEWKEKGEDLIPFVLEFDSDHFKKYIEQLNEFKTGIGIPDNFVPHSTFWLVNDSDKILGVVNIRHKLNDKLLKAGGHIGYGIRPSERRKGYATIILKLALKEAKRLGIRKTLITYDKDNIGSKKSILKNNGKLFQEYFHEGKVKLGFWIDL